MAKKEEEGILAQVLTKLGTLEANQTNNAALLGRVEKKLDDSIGEVKKNVFDAFNTFVTKDAFASKNELTSKEIKDLKEDITELQQARDKANTKMWWLITLVGGFIIIGLLQANVAFK